MFLSLNFVQINDNILTKVRSRDSSVGIATSYGLDGRHSIPSRVRDSSVLHSVETGCGTHSASYPKGTGGCFLGEGSSTKLSLTSM
jgi:hypothetical protein